MRWVESGSRECKTTVRTPCCTSLLGYVLMAAGILIIFLCVPFKVWMIVLGAALIVIGYFIAFGR